MNFIIPHLGSFADDRRTQLALIDHLVRHPNAYTDTSDAWVADRFPTSGSPPFPP